MNVVETIRWSSLSNSRSVRVRTCRWRATPKHPQKAPHTRKRCTWHYHPRRGCGTNSIGNADLSGRQIAKLIATMSLKSKTKSVLNTPLDNTAKSSVYNILQGKDEYKPIINWTPKRIGVKLVGRNRVFAWNFSQKYVSSTKFSPFNSRLNSASNGNTFIPGQSFGKNLIHTYGFP